MDKGSPWKHLFENWPTHIPQEGIVVVAGQETIPFVGYLLSEGLLLLERDRPDTSGARKVMLTFDEISSVRLTTPIELDSFTAHGFRAVGR